MCENTEDDMVGLPLIGDRFPEMVVKTTHGTIELPKDYAGKWMVLFSHPADFTPVCTTEFIGFAKKNAEFEQMDAKLIGLSIDQVHSHIKWVEWIEEHMDVKIPFPIIADTGNVAIQLGMIHPNKGSNTVRAVFIVDPVGVIRLIIYYPQEIGRSIDEVLRAVKALQFADKNHVSTPENWPNNDFLKDRVIVPPPSDYKTAMERKKSMGKDCYDWWFCTKKV
ncbi:MAG TPA: peroxiredoxin [Methanomassiliicoccales archaeon]|nr:peroxiredoxin [Methanomassiliicoccales archaeon]